MYHNWILVVGVVYVTLHTFTHTAVSTEGLVGEGDKQHVRLPLCVFTIWTILVFTLFIHGYARSSSV